MMDVLVNNVLKEYGDVKEEIKNLKALNIPQRCFLYIKQSYRIVWSMEKNKR